MEYLLLNGIGLLFGVLLGYLYLDSCFNSAANKIVAEMTAPERALLAELLQQQPNWPDLHQDYRRMGMLDNLVLGVASRLDALTIKYTQRIMRHDSMAKRVAFVRSLLPKQ